MKWISTAAAIAGAIFWASLALAACPTANPQTMEAYIYGCPTVTGPFSGSLIIPAVPSSTTAPISSLEGIAANLFVTLGDPQTLTNKTFTSPTINGGTLAGTIAGNFTFSGTPIYSGLSSGTCALNLALDSGNHLITTACGGGGGSGTVNAGTINNLAFYTGSTAVSSSNFLSVSGVDLRLNYNAFGPVPPAVAGTVLRAIGPDATQARITVDSYGSTSHFTGECTGGTAASPTAIGANAVCSNFTSSMWNGSSFNVGGGAFVVRATDTQTVGHFGARDEINTTPNGTNTPTTALIIENDGGIYTPGATGGSKGANSINVGGCFINNVPCAAGGSGSVGAGTAGQIAGYLSSGTGVAGITVSGDFTLSGSTGVGTINNNAISTAKINAGAVDLTSKVTGTLPSGNGGIGVSNPALYGTMIAQGAAGIHTAAPNTAGFVLTSNGGAADPSFQAPTGGSGGSAFAATFAGSGTHYTATATGFTLTTGNSVQGVLNADSVASADLAVNGGAAKPVVFNTAAGPVAVGAGGLKSGMFVSFGYDGTNYVAQTAPFSAAPITATATISPVQFGACQAVAITSPGQTITLPTSSTLAPGGCVDISTGDVTVQLAVTGASGDAIDNGMIGGGAANAAITLPANFSGSVTYSGTPGVTAFFVPLGPVQYAPLTWLPGQDLSLATTGIDAVRFATPRVVYGIRCKNEIVSTTGHLTFYQQSDSGTLTGGGSSRLDSGSGFDMTTAAGTTVSLTLASTPLLVPASYWVGMKDDASSTSGGGTCQITYR